MNEQSVTFVMPKNLATKLIEILDFTNDCGPAHEGWASPELESIREIVRESIDRIRA